MTDIYESKAFIYAENEGDILELRGCTIETLNCCTNDKAVCFCWLTVKGKKEPYRFFVENANACFFVQCSKEFYHEELKDFLEEDELVDLVKALNLNESVIQRIYVDADKEQYTYIDLIIEFTSGDILILHDDDHMCGEKNSKILFKSKNTKDFKLIL